MTTTSEAELFRALPDDWQRYGNRIEKTFNVDRRLQRRGDRVTMAFAPWDGNTLTLG